MLLLAFGCAPIVFDEQANGMEVTLDVGQVLNVSLPHSPGKAGFDRFEPAISGQAIRFLERGVDESTYREWFKFIAVEAGDATIRTFNIKGDDRRLLQDYTLNVNVRLHE